MANIDPVPAHPCPASSPRAPARTALYITRRPPRGPLWPNRGRAQALIANPQPAGIWPTTSFWWHSEHLALAFPVVVPLLLPGFAVAQVASLAVAALLGPTLEGFFIASAVGTSGALVASLLAFGLLERHIRAKAHRRAQARRKPKAIDAGPHDPARSLGCG